MWQVIISAGAGVIGLIGVAFLIKGILKASSGNKLMTDISRTILADLLWQMEERTSASTNLA